MIGTDSVKESDSLLSRLRVVPAKAGTQLLRTAYKSTSYWIPACAGMTLLRFSDLMSRYNSAPFKRLNGGDKSAFYYF